MFGFLMCFEVLRYLFLSIHLIGFHTILKLNEKNRCAGISCLISILRHRHGYHRFEQVYISFKLSRQRTVQQRTYVYYYNRRTVFNQLNTSVLHAKWDIIDMKMNPTGSSICTLSSNGASRHMNSNFGFNFKPLAICYSPDARNFASSDTNGRIHIFSVKGKLREARTNLR